MPQSLANVLVHLVFSTKHRHPWIAPELEIELYPYLAAICRSLNCPSLAIGGTRDHVHLLCSLSRTVAISKLLEEVKAHSSKWVKTKGPQLKAFTWQTGYGAFSIGRSQIDQVKQYLANQKEHHRLRSFQEEFRAFLRKYEISYDERYVWD